MIFKHFKTTKVPDSIFKSFVRAFNHTFNKKKDVKYFKKKYINKSFGDSFHCFLLDKNIVVGACNVIPYNYEIDNSKFLIGLAVDTFIHQDFRKKDPFILLKMYKLIRNELKKSNVVSTLAVPNDNAYMYWKKVVRMKDLLSLNYYIFPSNIFFKLKFKSHLFSLFISLFFLNFNRLINVLSKKNRAIKPFIKIDNDIDFQNQRYIDNQIICENKNFKAVFAIVYEDEIKTAYLIDFENKKDSQKDYLSLLFSFENIMKYKADILVHIGEIKFTQFLFFKLPKFLEPKPLNLIIDVYDSELNDVLMKSNNWDFGLNNFDVR